jgi:hypothetical protein
VVPLTQLPVAPPLVPYAETPSPAEFLSAAPASLNGSSPWAQRYAAELRRIWHAEAAEAPRTLQQHLGPSELGVECDRQVAGKLAALPTTNHVVDPWPSTRGRALHNHAEKVFDLDNLRQGFERWKTERKVTPHPEHPGTADLYDGAEYCVVDHKFLGESSMAKIRRRPANALDLSGPPRKYVGQLNLYGLGYLLEGFVVRRIVIAAYPATAGSLDGLYVWEHRFATDDGQIHPENLALLHEIFDDTARRKAQAAGIVAGRLRLEDVPAVPDTDECYFCPFYRPQAARDSGPGCPGSVVTTS